MSQREEGATMQTIADRLRAATSGDIILPRLNASQRAAFKWAQVDDGNAVLEIFCANAGLLITLADRYRIRACCLCEDENSMVEISEQAPQIECLYGDARDLPWKDNSFNNVFITCSGYTKNRRQEIAQELHRVIKEDGELIISIPLFPFMYGEIPLIGKNNCNLPRVLAQELFTLLKDAGFQDVSIRFSSIKYATLIAKKQPLG